MRRRTDVDRSGYERKLAGETVRQVRAEPHRHDQNTWGTLREDEECQARGVYINPGCDSAACLAGWVNYLRPMHLHSNQGEVGPDALRALGLDPTPAHEECLFDGRRVRFLDRDADYLFGRVFLNGNNEEAIELFARFFNVDPVTGAVLDGPPNGATQCWHRHRWMSWAG
jgi:hypothetical protein